jgi:hypothetical protein
VINRALLSSGFLPKLWEHGKNPVLVIAYTDESTHRYLLLSGFSGRGGWGLKPVVRPL